MEVSRDVGAWEKIIKNSPDIICTTDREGHFININEACKSILGYESGEIIGRNLREFIYPEDLSNTLSVMHAVINGYRTNSFKNRLIRNGGQKVCMLWSAAWSEEDGVVIAVGRDVTDQELARQKDELHKAMVEHGSDMLALFDEELTCLYAGNTSKALGYLPEELIGANALDYIHPEDIEMVKNSLSMVLASGGFVRTSDFRFKDADGKWRWVETTLSNQLSNPAVKALVTSSRDVTERINSRLRLEESEQKFKSLFDHHLDIVLFQDQDGIILDVNAATISFFGLQKQEIINRPFSTFIPPEVAPACKRKHQEALKGESVRYDITIPFEGKGIINFDILKIPIVVDGKAIGVYSILRDVTEITRSTTIISQQAAKLNTVMESITDAVFTLDRNWRFTYVNSELERLFATDRKALLGKEFWDLAGEKIKPTLFKQYHQAIKTGKPAHFETYLETYGMWLQVKAYPSEEGLSVFLDDVTEKVKAKQELEKLSLVASKTTNGVVINDAEGRTEWVNKGFTNLTGFSFSEAVGISACTLLQGEETDKATIKRISEKIKQGKSFSEEILNYKKSGEKIWLLLEMTPVLNEEGEVARLIIIQTDITFRKEAEANQLQLTRDLYTQNRDLQQFTYIVSHNLRAPVANAIGLGNLLAVIDKDTGEFDTTLDYLRTSIHKMDSVLKDLNTILSIRDKKGTIENEVVRLAPICRQVLEELQEPIEECGGEVLTNINESVQVCGNKAYLYSIFYNLLSNAIKYRSPERRLRVSIKCFGSTEKGCLISFSDNGSGFDMDSAGDKVFQLYKRFHTTSEGRGIGLYLIKSHLEAMGGHIEVTSQVMAGTKFLLYLK